MALAVWFCLAEIDSPAATLRHREVERAPRRRWAVEILMPVSLERDWDLPLYICGACQCEVDAEAPCSCDALGAEWGRTFYAVGSWAARKWAEMQLSRP